MTENISIGELTALVALFGAVLSGCNILLNWLVKYLTVIISPDTGMTIAEQSAQCRFDHEKIGSKLSTHQHEMVDMVRAQNERIIQLHEQNGKQLDYMREASHNAELRHQITVSHFQEQGRILNDILLQVKA